MGKVNGRALFCGVVLCLLALTGCDETYTSAIKSEKQDLLYKGGHDVLVESTPSLRVSAYMDRIGDFTVTTLTLSNTSEKPVTIKNDKVSVWVYENNPVRLGYFEREVLSSKQVEEIIKNNRMDKTIANTFRAELPDTIEPGKSIQRIVVVRSTELSKFKTQIKLENETMDFLFNLTKNKTKKSE
jgi:hypothetical protein